MNTQRRGGRLLLAWLCGGLVCGALARLPAQEPPPKFTGERLAVPPRQGDPWTCPETTLPEELVTAAKTLFDLGLADPRGCEYRRAEIVTYSLWGGGQRTETSGWVVPSPKPGGDRFLVGWNGLVYPALSIGGPADLKADVRKALEADRAARNAGDPMQRAFHSRFRGFDPTGAVPEDTAVATDSVLPLKACLLLRLGEEALAREIWTGWAAGVDRVNSNQQYIDKPYLVLAENWTWHLFDRAVGAHAGGDDRVALLTARALAAIGPKAAEAAARLGVQSYTTQGVRSGHRKDGSFAIETFNDDKETPVFLNESPTLRPLLADQERRERERASRKPPPPGEGRAARVAALIRELEEVSVPQMSQPGYPDLGASPVVKGLIAEGDAAVEPLLDVLEKDPRLTRTVSYWRDYSRDRNVVPVYQAAHYALARILETSDFDAADPKLDRRARTAAGARAYWAKFKGLSPAERWYRTLLDDEAIPDQWVQAAAHIVEPEPAGGNRMRGESLRGKRGPSVVELMSRRTRDLGRLPLAPDEPDRKLEMRMALDLLKWAPAAAVPALRDLMDLLRVRFAESKGDDESRSWPGGGTGVSIAELSLARVRTGDPRALDDYAAWIRSVPAKDLKSSLPGALEPLWRHPESPAIAEAAGRLFGDPGSAWLRELRSGRHDVAGLASSPLPGVPAFRKALGMLLTDRTRLGKATVKTTGAGILPIPIRSLSLEFDAGGGIGTEVDARDPLVPRVRGTNPFRVCDYYAWKLSEIDGFPACGPYWPEAKRDEAVAACSEFLSRYGARVQPADGEPSAVSLGGQARGRLVFPSLDHPATAAEVRDGLAIFSLSGEGPARVTPLAHRPIAAKWSGPKGRPRPGADEIVWIWQAEEVRKDGVWRRHYGLVGRHLLARAPADEVQVVADEDSPRGNQP